jgi:hypothetical protein
MPRQTDSPVMDVAVHEAGHALVAISHGIPIEFVELRVEECVVGGEKCWRPWGRVRVIEGHGRPTADHARRQLEVSTAGYAAQSLVRGTNTFSLEEFQTPDRRDFEDALVALAHFEPPVTQPSECSFEMREAWGRAGSRLVQRWEALKGIANSLARAGKTIEAGVTRLDRKELEMLVLRSYA